MDRRDGDGRCDHCDRTFAYYLVHNGFNESAYAYCRECGATAIFVRERMPEGVDIPLHGAVPAGARPLLAPCDCGGAFDGAASPRCPHCRRELSASEATCWLEANAPGTRLGWRWQRSWQGLYCIVIDHRVTFDPWRTR